MSHFLRSKKNRLLLTLFIISLLPFVARILTVSEKVKVRNEKYDAKLKGLSNINELISFVDNSSSHAALKSPSDTAAYVWELSNILKQRFYHADLVYRFRDNWVAWASGKLLWSHMSFIVLPNDILKHPHAICSQQTIVFMEALKKKGIDVRSVGLGFDEGPGHFVCEVRYEGLWHLYDVTIEPDWEKIPNNHMALEYYLSKKDTLYKAYEERLPKALFYKILERHTYGEINKMPAQNMKLFHIVTIILTYLLPLTFGALLIHSFLNKQTKDGKIINTSFDGTENSTNIEITKEKIIP